MRRSLAITGVATSLALSAPAHAYLDPGTGSIIVQGLLAGIAAVLAAAGVFWSRIKSALRSLFRGRKSTATDTAEDSRE